MHNPSQPCFQLTLVPNMGLVGRIEGLDVLDFADLVPGGFSCYAPVAAKGTGKPHFHKRSPRLRRRSGMRVLFSDTCVTPIKQDSVLRESHVTGSVMYLARLRYKRCCHRPGFWNQHGICLL